MGLCTVNRVLVAALGLLVHSMRLDAFMVSPRPAIRCRSSNSVSTSFWRHAPIHARGRVEIKPLQQASVEEFTSADLVEREFQLEELEDKDVSLTSVVLNADGTVTTGKTDGPLPETSSGTWTLDGLNFSMVLTRDFESSYPYTVTRKFVGIVDEVLPATDTLILSGRIVLDEMEVGYFKMISAPSDIMDTISHLDEKIRESHA